jgi:hypothetical protein
MTGKQRTASPAVPSTVAPSHPAPAVGPAPAGNDAAPPGTRALAIGVALVVGLAALSITSNLLFRRYITAASLPSGAVFAFTVTLAANAFVRRRWPRAALRPRELALVFGMLYVSAALPQAAVGETIVTLAVVARYFPRFAGLADGTIPPALLVPDHRAARLFYEGLSAPAGHTSAGAQGIPWVAWLLPLALWSVPVLLLLFSLFCLSRLLSRRWIDEERVTFPLMELPLEMIAGATDGRFWRAPAMWLGFAIPAVQVTIGELHSYFPAVPEMGQILQWKFDEALTTAPWNAVSGIVISVWPLIVGISYLLNSEVAISIWAFHLLFWAQLLAFAAAGHNVATVGAAPEGGFQPLEWIHWTEFGGCIALTIVIFASIRHDLAAAARSLVEGIRWPSGLSPRRHGEHASPCLRGERAMSPDAAAPRRERAGAPPVWALAGYLGANAALLAWSAALGLGVVGMAGFLILHTIIVLPLARLVAAGGLYLVDNGYVPQRLLWSLAGTQGLSAPNLYALNSMNALFGRADMSFLYFTTNNARLAEATKTQGRPMTAAVWLAVPAALVSAYLFVLLTSHAYGAGTFRAWTLTWNVPEHLDQLASALANRHGPEPLAYLGIGAGVAIASGLIFMNRRFLWWGISPLGFVVASSENITGQIWSSVFLGWLIATLIRRLGGLRVYLQLRPFFLGLILGDALTYCAIVLVESLVGVRGGGR